MHLTHLTIDGFGMLSELTLSDLSNGLNVFHGSNGSGKTTILQFLRGIFCGFGDARRMRLIPPLKANHAGGSVGMMYRDSQYAVIRHLRPDESDALAINLTQGCSEDVPGLRQAIRNLDRDLFYTLFAVGNNESHAIAPLVRLALQAGIPLQNSRCPARWIDDRVSQLKQERNELFHGSPCQGRIHELDQRRQALNEEIAQLTAEREHQHIDWSRRVEQLQEQLTRLQQEIDWLHVELQAAQADLGEVEGRLWSRRTEVVREEQQVERTQPARTPDWVTELHDLDAQIAHSQQVLKDLAESRKQLSLKTASFAGVETPDVDVFFERQRSSIRALEQQTEHLALMQQTLTAATEEQTCICSQLRQDLGSTLQNVQQQLYFVCQELSRQQAAHAQVLLRTQREGIDQCEREVIQQIQRLRLRRDALLVHPARSLSASLQHRTTHDGAYCECDRHASFVRELPQPHEAMAPSVETVISERVQEVSNARPDDADRAQSLRTRSGQIYRQWLGAQSKWCAAKQELDTLLQQPMQFADDPSLQRCHYEFTIVEQQLADAREQWQSLALLQYVLQGTQQQLQEEVRSPLVEQASGLLNRLTLGRYPKFHFDAESEQMLVQSDAGQLLAAHALSRGTLDQAALALRLVLWNHYVQQGMQLPLILDDVLNDSDEQRLQVAVEILAEFGATGQQILFFTCQEHLANLFEREGIIVRDLPGTTRGQATSSYSGHTIAPVVAACDVQLATRRQTLVTKDNAEPVALQRSQPDEPYWLQADSPLMNVPSLSAQMVRRLGSLGVRHVADLVDLDPESTDIPLDSLQISATTLRQWQAECRLLTCVPDLTGRDAQVLVAVGIMSPAELAEAQTDHLLQRLIRLRRDSGEHMALTWLAHQPGWPDAETVRPWPQYARRARSFRSAREWAATPRSLRISPRRDDDNRSGTHDLDDSRNQRSSRPGLHGHHSSESSAGARAERASHSSELPRMSLVSVETEEAADQVLRFFLNLDSPIVDAPSIGPKMAHRLEKIGVVHVSDLLNRDADVIAEKLDHSRTNGDTVRTWQLQSSLMCGVPEMRGHDVQVLVACDVVSAKELAAFSPAELFAIVGPFVATKEGQRLLRSSKVPDLQEVTDWISFAKQSRTVKAA